MIKNSILAAFIFLHSFIVVAATIQTDPGDKHRIATSIITEFIERYHYKKIVLNDKLSEEIWQRYFDSLDPNRSIFLQSDLDEFAKYKLRFDDALIQSDLTPAFEIFNRYLSRLENRVLFSLKSIDKKYEFNVDEEYVFDRQKKPWPVNLSESDRIWLKTETN